ncbi:hypothetical protein D9M72_544680 [compost metagenome]
MRGSHCQPMPGPAWRWATRIQRVLRLSWALSPLLLLLPLSLDPFCQWKRTRTSPRSLQYSSSAPLGVVSPEGPTTMALCTPLAVGLACRRAPSAAASAGRQGRGACTPEKLLA